jgi:hypothetical protein
MQGRAIRSAPVDAWGGVARIDVRGLAQGTYVLTLTADRASVHGFLHVRR